MANEDLSDALSKVARSPKSATADNTSATAQSIPDLIELDRYNASKRAAATGSPGFRVSAIRPGGPV